MAYKRRKKTRRKTRRVSRRVSRRRYSNKGYSKRKGGMFKNRRGKTRMIWKAVMLIAVAFGVKVAVGKMKESKPTVKPQGTVKDTAKIKDAVNKILTKA